MQYVKGVYNYKSLNDYDRVIEKLLFDFVNLNPDNIVGLKTKVDFHKNSNLSDISGNTDLLVTFANPFEQTDQSWSPSRGSDSRIYWIYLTMQKGQQEVLKKNVVTMVNGLTKNLNDDSGALVAFEHTILSNNTTYRINLNNNEVVGLVYTDEGEDPAQPNYVTAIVQIKFYIQS